MSKLKSITIWAGLGLTSVAFAAAGIAKLMGVEQLHSSFSIMGLPVWFGYFIGACELLGAIALWQRQLSFFSALGLLCITCGAIFFHLYFELAANAIPAIILAILLLFIAKNRITDRFTFS